MTIDKQKIAAAGYGISGHTGGIKRRTYWTPDGRLIKQIPQIIGTMDPATKEVGEKDGNLDNGWLLSRPETLLPYCGGCDRWHETEALVEECVERKRKSRKRFDRLAKKMQKGEEAESAKDERLDKLENMMGQILEALGGKVLQQSDNAPEEATDEESDGATEERVE